jgi:protein SCO1/2
MWNFRATPRSSVRSGRRASLAFLSVLLWLSFAGCERSKENFTPPATHEFMVHGVLKKIDAATGRAVISHEEIPGYMPAMAMEFQAAAPAELGGFEPGDKIEFRLRVTDTQSRIDRLRKVGRGFVPSDDAPGIPPRGTALPDVLLVDERGQPLRLPSSQGRVVAFTFIFTRCPLPDFCPRMNQHFAAVARALAKEPAGSWKLISISIDPVFDTPAVLAAYARVHRPEAAAEQWSFATGNAEEIRKLSAAVGVATKAEGASREHNLRTVVLDRDGKIRRVFAGNEWQPTELAAEMRRALQGE